MVVAENICLIFNKIYLNLIKDIKDKDDEVKMLLKSSYKVFDKKSSEYMDAFECQISDSVVDILTKDGEDIFDNLYVLNVNLFKTITIQDVLKKVIKDNNKDKDTFRYYVYILMVLGYLYKMEDIDDDKKYILLQKTLSIINSVDKNDVDMEKSFEDILDDDIRKILYKMYKDRNTVKEPVMPFDMENLDFLQNTKIGNLAKEISESININQLNMEDPSKLLDMESMMSGSNNMLSEIIGTVGSKITQKIESGEINQEELMKEAMDMMGTMNMSGHGNMMSQMMSMMGNNDMNPTKKRLQNKLMNKKLQYK